MGEIIKGDFGKEDPKRDAYNRAKEVFKAAIQQSGYQEGSGQDQIRPEELSELPDKFEDKLIEAFDRLKIEKTDPPDSPPPAA